LLWDEVVHGSAAAGAIAALRSTLSFPVFSAITALPEAPLESSAAPLQVLRF
jgi:hypothetical protein